MTVALEEEEMGENRRRKVISETQRSQSADSSISDSWPAEHWKDISVVYSSPAVYCDESW